MSFLSVIFLLVTTRKLLVQRFPSVRTALHYYPRTTRTTGKPVIVFTILSIQDNIRVSHVMSSSSSRYINVLIYRDGIHVTLDTTFYYTTLLLFSYFTLNRYLIFLQ